MFVFCVLYLMSMLCEVMVSGCSGTGAPTYALSQIIGPDNVIEMAASDKSAASPKQSCDKV